MYEIVAYYRRSSDDMTRLSLPVHAQGYVLLVYLAITTRNPKYIAFSALLGMFFLVIIVIVLVSNGYIVLCWIL